MSLDLEQITIPIRFTRRPISIAADYRPAWKISLLVLLLHLSSRGGRSSLKRLHVINWAVRTEQHRREYLDAVSENRGPLFALRIRFEPAFARAIDFAAAEKLITLVDGNRAQLTEAGVAFGKQLVGSKETMQDEIRFLKSIGKKLTEEQALSLVHGPDIA